jgi:hypothetical protein
MCDIELRMVWEFSGFVDRKHIGVKLKVKEVRRTGSVHEEIYKTGKLYCLSISKLISTQFFNWLTPFRD